VNSLTKYVTPKLYEDIQYAKFDHLYSFTVPQLIFLCQCIEEVKEVKGDIAEIGVYEGRTTVFLNKYMDAQKIDKKYYAIDTFSGFVPQDINYEVSTRQKDPSFYTGFKTSKKAFDITMKRNGIRRVVSIQADVNNYDLKSVGNLCFALLDVDLYLPMKKSLKELYNALSPNGIIIVDDCDPKNEAWDGSDQAYKEFMQEINQPIEIILGKLGIVRK
jgi:SAM-dependent methyltransferase